MKIFELTIKIYNVMQRIKSIIHIITAYMLLFPCVLLFNENEESIYINAIALLYCVLLYHASFKIKWLKRAYISIYKFSYKLNIPWK